MNGVVFTMPGPKHATSNLPNMTLSDIVTPLKSGAKGIGLFSRKAFLPGTVLFSHEFQFLHLVNHSCRPNSQWVLEKGGEATDGSDLPRGWAVIPEIRERVGVCTSGFCNMNKSIVSYIPDIPVFFTTIYFSRFSSNPPDLM